MTKTFCDFCKQEMLPQGIVTTKLRIDNLLHDFCNDCWTKLKTLLEGTGTQVIEIPPQQYQWPNQGITTVPNNPGIVPSWMTTTSGPSGANMNSDMSLQNQYTVVYTESMGLEPINLMNFTVTAQNSSILPESCDRRIVLTLSPTKE